MSEFSKVDKVVGKDFPDANAKLTRFLEEKQLVCIHDEENHGTKLIEQGDRELDDVFQQWW